MACGAAGNTPSTFHRKDTMNADDTGFIPPDGLNEEAVKRIEQTIARFKKEFGKRCNWADVPRPVDNSDRERDKALISAFGFCVKQLMNDPAMLQRAKMIPELASLSQTAEEFKRNIE